jgi:membrane complex biogenesis BtpA family protein
MMSDIRRIPLPFGEHAFIGMVHLQALPGSPRFVKGMSMNSILSAALSDTDALLKGGVDAILVENFCDTPFFTDEVPAITIASITRIVLCIINEIDQAKIPVGLNVLRNDASAALSIAAATGARFIRVNIHTGAMLTDQGVIEGRAADTLRLRQSLGHGPDSNQPIAILADVGVKHALPMEHQWSLGAEAKDSWHRGLADGLIISGRGTGKQTPHEFLEEVRSAVPEAPILIGSGMTPENFEGPLNQANGWIVGSSLKFEGVLENPVDSEEVSRFNRAKIGAYGRTYSIDEVDESTTPYTRVE